ncbi:MAG: pirin-like C-terminal cupin domain-containing protein, partial [Candidatus Puniceispirillaceae bacterium]
VYEGEMQVGDKVIAAHQLGVFGQKGALRLKAGAQNAGCLVMAGKPIGEPVAKMGPFVMNTEAEIRQAVQDYRAGRFAN